MNRIQGMFVLQNLRGRGRKRGFCLSSPYLFAGGRELWRQRERISSPQKLSEKTAELEDQGEIELGEKRERTDGGIFFCFFPLSSLFLFSQSNIKSRKGEELLPLFPLTLFRETSRPRAVHVLPTSYVVVLFSKVERVLDDNNIPQKKKLVHHLIQQGVVNSISCFDFLSSKQLAWK